MSTMNNRKIPKNYLNTRRNCKKCLSRSSAKKMWACSLLKHKNVNVSRIAVLSLQYDLQITLPFALTKMNRITINNLEISPNLLNICRNTRNQQSYRLLVAVSAISVYLIKIFYAFFCCCWSSLLFSTCNFVCWTKHNSKTLYYCWLFTLLTINWHWLHQDPVWLLARLCWTCLLALLDPVWLARRTCLRATNDSHLSYYKWSVEISVLFSSWNLIQISTLVWDTVFPLSWFFFFSKSTFLLDTRWFIFSFDVVKHAKTADFLGTRWHTIIL